MLIFAGLGNPGAQYALHRHNIGFMAVDAMAEMHGFGPWTKRFSGLVSAGRLGGERVILLKPQTFMNKSGQSIGEAMRFYKLTPADVTVFYDELDLAAFKVKVKQGGGAAGHNGIRSAIQHIGEDFRRIRIGIDHPGHKDRVTSHVLGNFAKAEMDDLAHLLGAIASEAHWLAEGNEPRFLSDIALRMRP
ncbi:MAG: aminoacyl-tRNA hydrolase [Pacificimonas sp.]